MRNINLATAGLLAMTVMPAIAQTHIGAALDTGARPGHQIGIGDSLPKSNNASNIVPGDTHTGVAPTLPPSMIGEDGSPFDFLRAARNSLTAGHTGQAQQSLEMAETRELDRSVLRSQGAMPSDNPLVGKIHSALEAIGTGNTAHAIQLIDEALAG